MRPAWLWKMLPWWVRERLLLGQLRFEETELSRYCVRLAQSRDELLGASRLMYEGYHDAQLTPEHPARIRYSSFWMLPTTHVLMAEEDGRLAATLSLVVDGALGVPLEHRLPELISSLRAEGRTLAEVGSLTIASGQRGRGLSFLLYKALYLLARDRVDDLIIAVRTPAVDVYRALLCFEVIGPSFAGYPGVDASVRCTPMRLRLRESVAIFQERFGHLALGWGNPLYLYTQRDDPSIQLPSPQELAGYAKRRLAASTQLITTRPDVLLDLPQEARNLVLSKLALGEAP